jgi:hypothetical protein
MGKKNNEPQYWVVGAAQAGMDDHYDEFVSGGYWRLFWNSEEKPHLTQLVKQIAPKDWIAIKKMKGGRSGQIRIRALGLVERTSQSKGMLYINWLERDLDRVVSGRGFFGSIHGPYRAGDEKIRDIFFASKSVTRHVGSSSSLPDDLNSILLEKSPDETSKKRLVDARIGQ